MLVCGRTSNLQNTEQFP